MSAVFRAEIVCLKTSGPSYDEKNEVKTHHIDRTWEVNAGLMAWSYRKRENKRESSEYRSVVHVWCLSVRAKMVFPTRWWMTVVENSLKTREMSPITSLNVGRGRNLIEKLDFVRWTRGGSGEATSWKFPYGGEQLPRKFCTSWVGRCSFFSVKVFLGSSKFLIT